MPHKTEKMAEKIFENHLAQNMYLCGMYFKSIYKKWSSETIPKTRRRRKAKRVGKTSKLNTNEKVSIYFRQWQRSARVVATHTFSYSLAEEVD